MLSDGELRDAIERGRIAVEPLEASAIQTASIDLTLHRAFWLPEVPSGPGIEITVDVGTARAYDYLRQIDADEIVLDPGDFVLGETAEGVSLADDLCGLIEGKSGRARRGLIVHCTAPHVAPGWGMDPPATPDGAKAPNPKRITLEIANLGKVPLKLRAGTGIAQLMVVQTGRAAEGPYSGQHRSEGTVRAPA